MRVGAFVKARPAEGCLDWLVGLNDLIAGTITHCRICGACSEEIWRGLAACADGFGIAFGICPRCHRVPGAEARVVAELVAWWAATATKGAP
jgi:hypothetical protein